jgi:prepilin-type N-terminal cleavage/methylation domain-containing protein
VHSHFAVGGALCPDHFTSLESRDKPAPTNQGFSLQKRFGSQYGFSLIEVLLSLGILSVAMLIIFAILTPFIAQTGEVIESSTVSRITDRISAEIEQLTFDELVAVLNQETGLFASRMGDQLVLSNDPELDTRLPEEDRYFAITLSRNQDISPTSRDTAAGFLAFQIKIDRLLHAPDGALIQSPLDQTQAVFNTAVLRTDS